MDYTKNHGGEMAPLSRLSSGHTYYRIESLQGITTLPPYHSHQHRFLPRRLLSANMSPFTWEAGQCCLAFLVDWYP